MSDHPTPEEAFTRCKAAALELKKRRAEYRELAEQTKNAGRVLSAAAENYEQAIDALNCACLNHAPDPVPEP